MEIIHIFPPNNNKYKNLLDMNDEKKIIIYQVFTRLFGNRFFSRSITLPPFAVTA